MTDAQVQELLMIFAMAAIVVACGVFSIFLLVYGVYVLATRQNLGDMIAGLFAFVCGLAFAGVGVWSWTVFRGVLLRAGA